MRLKLLLNIGKDDARRMELEKPFAGEVVDVPQEVADELLRNAWAVEPGAQEEARLKAVQPPGTTPEGEPKPDDEAAKKAEASTAPVDVKATPGAPNLTTPSTGQQATSSTGQQAGKFGKNPHG